MGAPSEELTAPLLAAIVASSDDAIVSKSLDGVITSWNAAAERLFGYSAAEAIGRHITLIAPAGRADEMQSILEQIAKGVRIEHYETQRRHKLGHLVDISLTVSPIVAEDGRIIGASKIARDIRERKKMDRQLKAALSRTETFLNTIVEHIPAMLFVKDATDGRFILLNRAGEALLGLPRDELIGKHDHDIFPQDEADYLVARDREVLQSGALQLIPEERIHTPNQGIRFFRTKKFAIRDEDGRSKYLVGISEDITEEKRTAERLQRMTRCDVLTGLVNRSVFRDHLAKVTGDHSDTTRRSALLLIDIDGFRRINDSLGHPVGDLLLRQIANRLSSCAAPTDIVARVGGDEFAMLRSPVSGLVEIQRLARGLVTLLTKPFELQGGLVKLTGSIGVSIAPHHGNDPDRLFRSADSALHRAKSTGGNRTHLYDRCLDERLQARDKLEADLEAALSRREFELHYQPFVDLLSGRLCGFEALIRWRHPEKGVLPPAEFIEVAEKIGFIMPIGEWVLRRACSDAAKWPTDVRVAVNLSPTQFESPLRRTVSNALAASGLAPTRLELEITESALLRHDSLTLDVLHHLRALGVRIAMDDFGTGYSSLSYLPSFPFDKIKIDGGFVKDIRRQECMAIIRAVAALGRSLGLPTAAEGVETKDQFDAVRDAGCTEAQGFYIGHPKPLNEIDIATCVRDLSLLDSVDKEETVSGKLRA